MQRRQFICGAASVFLAGCGQPDPETARRIAAGHASADSAPGGALSQQSLDQILARSIDMKGWSQLLPYQPGDAHTQHLDNIRMLGNVGARLAAFVANPFLFLDTPFDADSFFSTAARICADIHAALPDMVVGGACYETTAPAIGQIPVPDWVFQEFALPVQARHFDWQQMCYPDQRVADGNPDSRAIDITRIESQMWYFYMCRRFIDAGFEDICLGELFTITQNDLPGYRNHADLVARIRRYARTAARRGFVLLSSQTYPANDAGQWDEAGGKHGPVDAQGNLLFDYCYAGMRPRENPDFPYEATLAVYRDVIFGRSRGGIHPLGWTCARGPYIVQLDNGASPQPRTALGWPYVWGWSEPDWYINQTPAYRRDWMRYAATWVARTDGAGHFRPTGMNSGGGLPGIGWYHANNPWYGAADDPDAPDTKNEARDEWFKGFGDEPEIAALWSATGRARIVNGSFARPALGAARPYALAPAMPSWEFGGESGVALAASAYGNPAVPAGQYGFAVGGATISQAVLFNAAAKCSLMVRAAQRATASKTDRQAFDVTVDGVTVGQVTPDASLASVIVPLGTLAAGVRVVGFHGKSTADGAILTDARLLTVADYANVVQQLYLAYYGRPADPGGLDYWADVFLGTGAAIEAQDLVQSYAQSGPRFLVDSFGNSRESLDLYGSGNYAAFVSAVYANVLGRGPDAAGSAYWVDLIQRGLITQAQAALSILASATIQGPASTDFQIVDRRLKAALYFTDQVRAKGLGKAYSGSVANGSARAMLAAIRANTGDADLQSAVDATIAGFATS